jgi:hypothetical protein
VDYLMQKEEQALAALGEAHHELMEARAMVMEKVTGVAADDSENDLDPDSGMLEEADVEHAGVLPAMEEQPFLRKRVTNASRWRSAERMAQQIRVRPGDKNAESSVCTVTSKGTKVVAKEVRNLAKNTKQVISFLDHPTYAVVTFTSRQAAIAARQCLTDGGGLDRWIKIDELPITPLADAPPRSILHCRGVCRPVTLTISDNEKYLRSWS